LDWDTSELEWPSELDALRAAPGHHRLLLENDAVRVIETLIGVGETTPVHTHRWASVGYVVGGTQIVRRDGDRNILLDTRISGDAPRASEVRWADPLAPHSVENVGDHELRVIMVECKGVVTKPTSLRPDKRPDG
jgi:hypothetical protein